jgi:hypothetical protein
MSESPRSSTPPTAFQGEPGLYGGFPAATLGAEPRPVVPPAGQPNSVPHGNEFPGSWASLGDATINNRRNLPRPSGPTGAPGHQGRHNQAPGAINRQVLGHLGNIATGIRLLTERQPQVAPQPFGFVYGSSAEARTGRGVAHHQTGPTVGGGTYTERVTGRGRPGGFGVGNLRTVLEQIDTLHPVRPTHPGGQRRIVARDPRRMTIPEAGALFDRASRRTTGRLLFAASRDRDVYRRAQIVRTAAGIPMQRYGRLSEEQRESLNEIGEQQLPNLSRELIDGTTRGNPLLELPRQAVVQVKNRTMRHVWNFAANRAAASVVRHRNAQLTHPARPGAPGGLRTSERFNNWRLSRQIGDRRPGTGLRTDSKRYMGLVEWRERQAAAARHHANGNIAALGISRQARRANTAAAAAATANAALVAGRTAGNGAAWAATRGANVLRQTPGAVATGGRYARRQAGRTYNASVRWAGPRWAARVAGRRPGAW